MQWEMDLGLMAFQTDLLVLALVPPGAAACLPCLSLASAKCRVSCKSIYIHTRVGWGGGASSSLEPVSASSVLRSSSVAAFRSRARPATSAATGLPAFFSASISAPSSRQSSPGVRTRQTASVLDTRGQERCHYLGPQRDGSLLACIIGLGMILRAGQSALAQAHRHSAACANHCFSDNVALLPHRGRARRSVHRLPHPRLPCCTQSAAPAASDQLLIGNEVGAWRCRSKLSANCVHGLLAAESSEAISPSPPPSHSRRTLTLFSSASASRPRASARALMSSLTRSSFDSAAFVAACCATSTRCPSTCV
jgi:hypothetical protein